MKLTTLLATFALLAVLTVAALVWTWRSVPETRGKTLEEVTALFEEHP